MGHMLTAHSCSKNGEWLQIGLFPVPLAAQALGSPILEGQRPARPRPLQTAGDRPVPCRVQATVKPVVLCVTRRLRLGRLRLARLALARLALAALFTVGLAGRFVGGSRDPPHIGQVKHLVHMLRASERDLQKEARALALYRHRRGHVCCTGVGVPVLKIIASAGALQWHTV